MTPDELCKLVWSDEPRPKDEGRKTPGGEGWLSWNGKAPEWEFCEFAGSLVRLLHPKAIIETGMGAGFLTRRLAGEVMTAGWDPTLTAFESDPDFREAGTRHAWPEVTVSADACPSEPELANADLLVLDSAAPWRRGEFAGWIRFGKPGSYCLMHDVDPTRERGTVQADLAEMIATSGLTGVLLSNPRGGWLGRHP